MNFMASVFQCIVVPGSLLWLLSFACMQVQGQPLDTTEAPLPAAKPRTILIRDTLPVHTGTSDTNIVESVSDSVRLEQQPPGPQAIQVNRLTVPPDDNQKFSLFNYAKIVAIGPSLCWFYYNEHPDINPIIRQFRNQYLFQPSIIGTPKSSEYGAVMGFNLNIARFVRKPHLFIRTQFALLLGIANTYDGSSQAADNGTGGIVFTPHKEQKNNTFLTAGLDIGPAFADAKCPWTAYSGLDIKVWNRDMTFYSQQSSSSSASELYYWFSVPLAAQITRPASPHLLLGVEPRVDFMFYGRMQVSENSSYYGTINYPTLTLGNRASFRCDAFMQTRLGTALSLKFGPYAMLYGFAQSNTDTVTIPANYGNSSQRMPFLEPASASLWIGFNFHVTFLRDRIMEEKGK
jgi:hypothetical protein